MVKLEPWKTDPWGELEYGHFANFMYIQEEEAKHLRQVRINKIIKTLRNWRLYGRNPEIILDNVTRECGLTWDELTDDEKNRINKEVFE